MSPGLGDCNGKRDTEVLAPADYKRSLLSSFGNAVMLFPVFPWI